MLLSTNKITTRYCTLHETIQLLSKTFFNITKNKRDIADKKIRDTQ